MAHIRTVDLASPSEKSIQAKMDEHLSNTRIDIRTALQRFQKYGVKIDRRFERDFIKQTTDCVIDTCEQYCKKVRHPLSRKDGRSNTETVRKTNGSGKRRHSKERRSMDRRPTQKDNGSNIADDKKEPRKKSQKSDQHMPDSSNCKRPKTDDTYKATDVTDKSKVIAENPEMNVVGSKTPPPPPSTVDQSQSVDQPVFFFYCAHCLDANESGESIGGSIADVYSHWQSLHIVNLSSKPFEFAVAQIGVCHFGDAIGTYRELLKHHQQNHAGERLAIVSYEDRKKCGICLKSLTEPIVDHFELEHKTVSQADTFNPMRLSERQLGELLAIEIHQKRQCGHCEAIFETENEIDIHHSIGHANEPKISKAYQDNCSPYLICGYCQYKIDRDTYFSHLKTHPYVFKCWKCSYQTNDLVHLIFHDKQKHERDTMSYHCAMFADWVRSHFYKTRIIFPNGLALKMHNVFGTQFDDNRLFEMFLDGLIDVVKSKFAVLEQHGEINAEKMVNISAAVAGTPSKDADGADTVDGAGSGGSGGGGGCGGDGAGDDEAPSTCSTADESAFVVQALQKQNELANDLVIMKLPRMTLDIEPTEIFLILCRRLNIPVNKDDILQAYRRNDGDVVVTLKDYDHKEQIRYAAAKHIIKTDMLFDLQAGQWNKTIKVLSHTTRYYSEMLSMAREAKKVRNISFYELTKKGIVIRRSATSDERIFISKIELANYLGRYSRSSTMQQH